MWYNYLGQVTSSDIFGEILHQGWTLKKQLASSVSNDKIDEYYEKAISAGALGGESIGGWGRRLSTFILPQAKAAASERGFKLTRTGILFRARRE